MGSQKRLPCIFVRGTCVALVEILVVGACDPLEYLATPRNQGDRGGQQEAVPDDYRDDECGTDFVPLAGCVSLD
jgi:hypothetical protein